MLALVTSVALTVVDPRWALAILGPYALANVAAGIARSARASGARPHLVSAAYAVMHAAYGCGFLAGLAFCRPRSAGIADLQGSYASRDDDPAYVARHSIGDPAHRAALEERTRAVQELLGPAAAARVLDVGCGGGDSLASLPGAASVQACGVDLVHHRLTCAADRVPGTFASADARELPFPDATFDLCLLFTVLSSLPGPTDRADAAAESLRVVRPGGRVLVYEFAVAPPGRGTRGLRRGEWEVLFPGCPRVARSVTLAPPLARFASRISPRVRAWLARFPVLRTHRLVLVEKP